MTKWFYFSDTNAPSDEINVILQKQQNELNHFYRLEEVIEKLKSSESIVLFLRANTHYNGYDLCQELSVKFPNVYIVLIVPDNMENTKKAMNAGASNLLRYSAEEEEKRDVIIQAGKYMKLRETDWSFHDSTNCKVISVCSTKGGIGRTTTSVNLAAAFAKQGKNVGILDADLQFGDVTMYLDLKPSKTIYEWVKEGYERKVYSIEKYLSKHESGVSVFPAPLRPEFFEMITEDHIERAIEEMKMLFDVIVIDTSSSLSEVHLKCLELSDECLLLVTSNIPVLRRSKLYIETLESFNLGDKLKIIEARSAKKKVLDLKKMEQMLGKPFTGSIPDQDSITDASINTGIPFLLSHPRSPIGKSIIILAQNLDSPPEEESLSRSKKKKGLRRLSLVKEKV
ncbi:AAA family ATPase [Bacillus salacetis]|uniref:AAA family ATPase n=1 Tax=Bacillus salacetis TaxID=2315464 RepID=UPI003BA3167E